MKDFLGKLQKDLKHLQSTIEKEGNDLLKKAKKAVDDMEVPKKVNAKTKELEKLIESKFDKFEPALYKFIGEVAKNAKKYGLEVGDLEKIVRSSVKKAKSSLSQKKSASSKKAKPSKPKAKAAKTPSGSTNG
jgi:hypothetical protein